MKERKMHERYSYFTKTLTKVTENITFKASEYVWAVGKRDICSFL